MNPQVLIAVESEYTLETVFNALPVLDRTATIRIFSVLPIVDLMCELNPYLMGALDKNHSDYCRSIEDEKQKQLEGVQGKAMEKFIKSGFGRVSVTAGIAPMTGDIATTILHEGETDTDLIIIGRHGKPSERRFPMRSTAQKIVQAAGSCPVMIVG